MSHFLEVCCRFVKYNPIINQHRPAKCHSNKNIRFFLESATQMQWDSVVIGNEKTAQPKSTSIIWAPICLEYGSTHSNIDTG